MEQYCRGIKGLEVSGYVNGHPRYGNRGMVYEVLNLGERTVGTEVSYLGRTELMNIVRIHSSLCRGRSVLPYPGWA